MLNYLTASDDPADLGVPVPHSREPANIKIDNFLHSLFPYGGTQALLRPWPRHRDLWSQASAPPGSLWRPSLGNIGLSVPAHLSHCTQPVPKEIEREEDWRGQKGESWRYSNVWGIYCNNSLSKSVSLPKREGMHVLFALFTFYTSCNTQKQGAC